MPKIYTGIGIGIGMGGGVASQTPEAKAYFLGLITPVSAIQKKKIDKFVRDVKSGLGIMNLSDAFDVLRIQANETIESSLRNLAKDAHHAIAVNSPAFIAYEGIKGNGVSSYTNSNYNPSVQGVRYARNNASAGFYCRSNIFGGSMFGAGMSTTWLYFNIANVNGFYTRINDGTTITGTVMPNVSGLTTIVRSASNAGRIIKNKGLIGPFASTSTGSPSVNIYEGAYNNNGSAAEFNTNQLSLIFYGRAFTDLEISIITDAFEVYMDSNGKGVIA